MPVKVVPYPGELKQGYRGREVTAIKRSLSHAGYFAWKPRAFTRLWGPFTTKAIKKFQKDVKLPQTGTYTQATHRKLSPHFDAYSALLMGYKKPGLSVTRQRIMAAAMTLRNRRATVHYSMTAKRMQIVREKMTMFDLATKAHIYEDCSSSLTGCYYVADAPDPNGRNYDGFGYTGTLALHGKLVSLSNAKPGDAVIYGKNWPFHHVAIYIGKNMVWSHGSEGGPFAPVAIDYRSDRAMIRNYLGD